MKNFKTWKNYKELLKICKLIVFRRNDDEDKEIDKEFLKNSNIIILKNEYYNYSSTEIREKVKNGEDISNLVNKNVEKIILQEYKD